MKKYLLSAFCLTFSMMLSAQEFPYSLSTFEDDYVPLSEALAVTSQTDENWDDPSAGFYSVPIGFEFELLGRSDDVLAVIDPGCQLVIGINEDTMSVMSPYFADFRNADTLEVVSAIVHTTEGNVGNRIFKIEWQNVGFYNEFDATGSFPSTTNFQVWLYETSHDVEFRFGPNTIKDGTLIHMEWPAPLLFFIQDFILATEMPTYSWSLMGNASNPFVSAVNLFQNPSMEELLIGEPGNGTVYHFDALETSVNENDVSPHFTVFPTLVTDRFQTYWKGSEPTDLQIYTSEGKLLHRMSIQHGNTMINTSSWSDGVYMLTVGEGPAITTKRIIKN